MLSQFDDDLNYYMTSEQPGDVCGYGLNKH